MKTGHKTTTKCPNFCQRFYSCILQNKAETQEIQELNLQRVCFHLLYRICLFSESGFPYSSQNLLFHILQRIQFPYSSKNLFSCSSQNLIVSIFFKESICFHVLHRIWLFPYSSKNLSVFMFFTESGCFHILQRIYLSMYLSVSMFFTESVF